MARRAEAVARHAAQAARVHDLTNLLGSALVRTKRFDLAALVKVPQRSEFEPGEAGLALVPPHWADFAPDETPVRRRLLDDQKHRELRLADAKDRFQRALRVHGDAEIARQSELVGAQRIHFDRGAASDAEAKAHNDGLDVFASVLDGGDPAAVAQVILRTLHELFHSDSRGWLQTVTLNGMIRQTGTARHDRGVCLETLRTSQGQFDPRHVLETDVLADLDHRLDVVDLTAGQFEHLVHELLPKMGLHIKHIRSSEDGVVDCLAFDARPVLGGDVVVHAARHTQSLGVWTVQRFHRAVKDVGASKGILITTAGIDSASHAYASGKPLELIDGTGILGLIAQHTGIRVRLPHKDRRATSRD